MSTPMNVSATIRIDVVDPHPAAAGDRLLYTGSGLGLVNEAVFVDRNGKWVYTSAKGEEHGNEAKCTLPAGLAIGQGTTYLRDVDGLWSNGLRLDFIAGG